MTQPPYSQFSVTIPHAVAQRVRLESERTGTKISTLMARALMAWFEGVQPVAEKAQSPMGTRAMQPEVSVRKGHRLTNEEFDVIAAGYRGSSQLVNAARLVLVEGHSQAQAARLCEVSHRQAVYRVIKTLTKSKNLN
jgi:hypothetical protein